MRFWVSIDLIKVTCLRNFENDVY